MTLLGDQTFLAIQLLSIARKFNRGIEQTLEVLRQVNHQLQDHDQEGRPQASDPYRAQNNFFEQHQSLLRQRTEAMEILMIDRNKETDLILNRTEDAKAELASQTRMATQPSRRRSVDHQPEQPRPQTSRGGAEKGFFLTYYMSF